MDFRNTETEKNIQAAFAGESQARTKYIYYAEQARKEGNEDLGALFEKMAQNETAHAKIWFKLLNDGIRPSEANLIEAVSGEGYEWQKMYPSFAAKAREEGFDKIAAAFEQVASIEKSHEETFMRALSKLSSRPAPPKPVVPVKPKPQFRCRFCGYIADDYLDVCPVCEAIGAFERVVEEL